MEEETKKVAMRKRFRKFMRVQDTPVQKEPFCRLKVKVKNEHSLQEDTQVFYTK